MKHIFVFLIAGIFLFSSCKNNSDAVIASDAKPVANAVGTAYQVETTTSKVIWKGFKPTENHYGTFPVRQGTITIENGVITSGSFIMDMNKLTVDDLQGDKKVSLENHLKGTGEDGKEDFFNVAKFPTAQFEITKVTGLANDNQGNALVYGNLTLLDVTKEVQFKANINIIDNNVTVVTPPFSINRTDWGLKYKSKTFSGLKDKFILDEVELQINLNATISQ